MTIQMSDHVTYKDKRYVLVDTESYLIGSADFDVTPAEGINTACWRGYTAEYEIVDNVLYGIKSVMTFNREKNKPEISSSSRLKMNYTGSILIARTNNDESFIADFLESYLCTDEAYELHFDNGVLNEEISLKEVLDEWEEIEAQIEMEIKEKISKGIYKEKYEGWDDINSKQCEFAKDKLKYNYCNYKWGHSGIRG